MSRVRGTGSGDVKNRMNKYKDKKTRRDRDRERKLKIKRQQMEDLITTQGHTHGPKDTVCQKLWRGTSEY